MSPLAPSEEDGAPEPILYTIPVDAWTLTVT